MQWPEGAHDPGRDVPQLWIGPTGRVEPTDEAAAAADDRFEAVCAELGILLARRVEPVSARVLPFGTEQLAMVQVLDGTEDEPTLLTAAARGRSRAVAVAEAAIDAMTGGNNVLAAALPTAVADGKVRTALVFAEGDAPLRWGLADDEGRLAALYAVVPHLGTFTATAGADTYRVLRLPGVGVSLVSEGPSAAAWVEGWFAALIHATQFALRTAPPTTSVVASAPTPIVDLGNAAPSQVLTELEVECRRILAAAQEQAVDILAKARSEATHEDDERRLERARLETLRAELRTEREDEERRGVRTERHTPERYTPERRDLAELERLTAERERLASLTDTERERANLLAESRREAEAVRRDAERDRVALLADAKREVDALLRDAERARTQMLEDVRQELDELRHDAAKARRKADDARRGPTGPRPEGRWMRDAVGEARRAADEVLADARRSAERIVADATAQRERLMEELHRQHVVMVPPGTDQPPSTSSEVDDAMTPARAAELALLTAAAESVTAMATLLGRVASAPRPGAEGAGQSEPLADVARLFFGA